MVVNENLAGIVITQILRHLVTTTTQSESRDQCHAKVGTQEEGETEAKLGSMSLMTHCHAKKLERSESVLQM